MAKAHREWLFSAGNLLLRRYLAALVAAHAAAWLLVVTAAAELGLRGVPLAIRGYFFGIAFVALAVSIVTTRSDKDAGEQTLRGLVAAVLFFAMVLASGLIPGSIVYSR